jgi:hypothetical protein
MDTGMDVGMDVGMAMDAGMDAGPPPVTVEQTCTTVSGTANDCTCATGEVAISGGAYAGQTSYMLNANQAGPSYGGSGATWRVSCVTPTSGTRVGCSQPFSVCLGGASASAVHVETTNCTAFSTTAAYNDCTCTGAGEVAISGGAYSGQTSYMLNALQAGLSYGAAAATWRVSCSDTAGNRVACSQPYVVCMAAPYASSVHVETGACNSNVAGVATDCTCAAGEVAISGGAYSGGGNMLNASQAGPSYGASAQTWRVSCVNPSGTRVTCVAPFAVCAASGF